MKLHLTQFYSASTETEYSQRRSIQACGDKCVRNDNRRRNHQNIEFCSRFELGMRAGPNHSRKNYNSHRSANSPALDHLRLTELCRLTLFWEQVRCYAFRANGCEVVSAHVINGRHLHQMISFVKGFLVCVGGSNRAYEEGVVSRC
jgi:hypothetical protein